MLRYSEFARVVNSSKKHSLFVLGQCSRYVSVMCPGERNVSIAGK